VRSQFAGVSSPGDLDILNVKVSEKFRHAV
jgi:hypothetical protein